jgi:adenylate kinase family enzyme
VTADPTAVAPRTAGIAGTLSSVLVIGSSGAGKTRFARALAGRLDCRHVELDELFWGPDWTPKPEAEFRRLVAAAVTAERWVADGNYSAVRDLLWPRAERVIWLNYGFARVAWRSLSRTLARCVTRQQLWHGNRESARRAFASRQSILLWVATTFRRRRAQFMQIRAAGVFAQLEWLEFRHPGAAQRWLRSLPQGARSAQARDAWRAPEPAVGDAPMGRGGP